MDGLGRISHGLAQIQGVKRGGAYAALPAKDAVNQIGIPLERGCSKKWYFVALHPVQVIGINLAHNRRSLSYSVIGVNLILRYIYLELYHLRG